MPATMQAVVIYKTGGPEVLELVPDYPVPKRAAGQVLVRLHSSSVNPSDLIVRAADGITTLPKILGGDVAGVVEEADTEAQFQKGDKVAALTPGYFYDKQEGTYAQYAAVDEAHLAKLPAGVDLSTAGGIPLVALTAWQAMHAGEKMKPGNRLLVLAASGGVGHFAVQFGKALGLYVVGVAGPSNAAWVKKALGADEVVDYSKQDYADVYANNPFDIVLDLIPGQLAKVVSVLKRDGHYAHIMLPGEDQEPFNKLKEDGAQGKGPIVTVTLVEPNGSQLSEILGLIDAGKVKLEVAKVYPLAEVVEASKQVETGRTRGKVVLAIP